MESGEIDDIEEFNDFREAEDNRIRFSRLKLIARSPAHYRYAKDRDTSAKDKGSAVHAILKDQRIIYYDKKTKDGRSAPRRGKEWEEFKALNQDAVIVTPKEYEDVNGMIESLRAHPRAMELLDGVREETLMFEVLGLQCRSTPDVREPNGAFVTELKTCQSSDPRRFVGQSLWMGYHAQMAMHRMAMARALGHRKPQGYIVAVESAAPFPVTVYHVDEKAFEAGEKQIRMWMETLRGCIQSNQWPAYAQSDVEFTIPEDEIDIGEAYSSTNLPEGW